MGLPDVAIKKLAIDDDLRETIERARAVTSPIARRRAERALAGELRRFELAEIEDQLAKLHDSEHADARQFQLAEHWRARMIEEGLAAVAEFPGGADDQLPKLIEAAQRERATGKPPGAARALFRHVAARLRG